MDKQRATRILKGVHKLLENALHTENKLLRTYADEVVADLKVNTKTGFRYETVAHSIYQWGLKVNHNLIQDLLSHKDLANTTSNVNMNALRLCLVDAMIWVLSKPGTFQPDLAVAETKNKFFELGLLYLNSVYLIEEASKLIANDETNYVCVAMKRCEEETPKLKPARLVMYRWVSYQLKGAFSLYVALSAKIPEVVDPITFYMKTARLQWLDLMLAHLHKYGVQFDSSSPIDVLVQELKRND